MTGSQQRFGRLLLVVAAGFYALSVWGRPGDAGSEGWLAAVVACLGLVAVIAIAIRLRNRVRRDAVRHQRPDAVLWQVWADAGLGEQLARHGAAVPRLSSGGGTAMTLAVCVSGVQLWHGVRRPRMVLLVPWTHVTGVHPARGVQNGVQRPAVAICTRADGALVLIPARTPAGLLLPASVAQAHGLVEELRGRHVGATAA